MIRVSIPPTPTKLKKVKKKPKALSVTQKLVTRNGRRYHRGHWNEISNQKAFLDDLAKKLNLHYPEEWCTITRKTFQQYGGRGLLQKYNDSVSKLLISVNPSYKQMCRNFVMNIVQDMKLSSPVDVVNMHEYRIPIAIY